MTPPITLGTEVSTPAPVCRHLVHASAHYSCELNSCASSCQVTASLSDASLEFVLSGLAHPEQGLLFAVKHAAQSFRCVSPILYTLKFEEDMILLDCEAFDIYIACYSEEEAVRQLNEELVALWVEYAQANDNELTKDALDLKYRLRACFRPE